MGGPVNGTSGQGNQESLKLRQEALEDLASPGPGVEGSGADSGISGPGDEQSPLVAAFTGDRFQPPTDADAKVAADQPKTPPVVGVGGYQIAEDGSILLNGKGAVTDPELIQTLRPLAEQGGGSLFGSVKNPLVLARIQDKLTEIHQHFSKAPANENESLLFTEGRSAALSLLMDLGRQAQAIGNTPLRDGIVDTLGELLLKEPSRELRDFMYERSIGLTDQGLLPDLAGPEGKTARETLYPSAPPYEKWLEDGTIKSVLYIDHEEDGILPKEVAPFLEKLGFTQSDTPEGTLWSLPADPVTGAPAQELLIPPKDPEGLPPMFDPVDDPTVDMIIYAGHAGHGRGVEHALENGYAKGTGAGKVMALLQCSGDGSIEEIERAFPDLQLVTTETLTSMAAELVTVEGLLRGFQFQAGWADISATVTENLKVAREYGLEDAGFFKPSSHILYPNQRNRQLTHYDRDRDGRVDKADSSFNVSYGGLQTGGVGGFDPVVQTVPSSALDASVLTEATENLSLVMTGPTFLGDPPPPLWDPDALMPMGFFDPAPGDNRAFRFEVSQDPVSGEPRLAIQLSSAYAHAPRQVLSEMLAFEAGLFLADHLDLPPAQRQALGIGPEGMTGEQKVAFALTLYDRARYEHGEREAIEGPLGRPEIQENLFQRRYGLEGLDLGALKATLDIDYEHDEAPLPSHFQSAVDYVTQGQVDGDRAAAPGLVGKPIQVPTGADAIRIDMLPDILSHADAPQLLDDLGIPFSEIKDTDVYFQPGQSGYQGPRSILILYTDPQGKTGLVNVGMPDYHDESSDVVLNASAFTLDVPLESLDDPPRSLPGDGLGDLGPVDPNAGWHEAAPQGGEVWNQALQPLLDPADQLYLQLHHDAVGNAVEEAAFLDDEQESAPLTEAEIQDLRDVLEPPAGDSFVRDFE